jgi:hypothetical protein
VAAAEIAAADQVRNLETPATSWALVGQLIPALAARDEISAGAAVQDSIAAAARTGAFPVTRSEIRACAFYGVAVISD